MKKHYLIGALIAATGIFAATASLSERSFKAPEDNSEPYSVPVTLKPVVAEIMQDGWDVLDNNKDEVKWSVYGSQVRLRYSAPGVTQDDYLFSPAVSLEAGQTYTFVIDYEMGNQTYTENLSVYVATTKDVAEVKQEENLIFSRKDSYASANTVETSSFSVDADGDYYFAFYCDSPGDHYYVFVNEFSVLGKVAPNSVASLKATPAADKSISCELSWVLPTTNNAGAALGAIEKVVVFRDDVQIKELDGTTTSFTDTEADGLTAGEHTYAVMVVADGTESDKAVTSTVYVGPLEPKSIPATFEFASEADFNNWVVIKGSSSTNSTTWKYNSVRNYAGYDCEYNWRNPLGDDDWLIAPPVKVEEAGYFKVVVVGVKEKSAESKLYLVMGTAPTTEMTVVGEAFDLPFDEALTPDFASDAAKTAFDVYLEPGTYYFGVHNRLGANFSAINTYKIGGVSVETSQAYPGEVTNLNAQGASDYSKTLEISWTNPTVDQTGQPWGDKSFVVKVYVGDSETPAKTITDGATSCTIPVEAEGSYVVTVVTETAEGATSGKKVTAKTGWVGLPFVTLPYSTTFDSTKDAALEIWKANIVDGNQDGITFESANVYDWGEYIDIIRVQSGATEYDDYILSPYFALNAGTYKVELSWSGGAYDGITVVAGFVVAGNFDKDALDNSGLISTQTLNSYYEQSFVKNFVIPAEGNYQFVIGQKGVFNAMYALEIHKFEIVEEVTYPGDVTDLKVVADSEDDSKAIVSWTNPTTCYESDEALTSIEAIAVLRDGELIATVTEAAQLTPGAEGSFVDELEEGGKYTYTVYPTVNGRGHGGEYPTVTSAWIGGGLTGLDMDAEDERWSFIDKHNDFDADSHKYGWCVYAPVSTTFLYYHHDGEGDNEADDYLVTPPVRVAEGNIYEVAIEVLPGYNVDSKAYNAAVKMGVGADSEGWNEVHTINIASDAIMTTAVTHKFNVAVGSSTAQSPKRVEAEDGEGEEEEVDPAKALYDGAVKLAAGSHTIAIHATEVGGMRIQKLSFKKVAEYTPVTTGLESVSTVDFDFDGHTVTFAGVADVEIYNLAGVCVHRAHQCKGSCDVPPLTPGIYFIKVNDRVQKFIAK